MRRINAYLSRGQGAQNSGAQWFRSILVLVLIVIVQLDGGLVGKLDRRPSRSIRKLVAESNVGDSKVALGDEADRLILARL